MKNKFTTLIIASVGLFALASCGGGGDLTISITNKAELQATWEVGDEARTLTYTSSASIDQNKLSLKISDDTVVSADGMTLTALKNGSSTVDLLYDNKTYDSVNIHIGSSFSMSITNKDDLQAAWKVGDEPRTVTYTSSSPVQPSAVSLKIGDDTVVSADGMTLTALKAGTTTVELVYENKTYDSAALTVGDSEKITIEFKHRNGQASTAVIQSIIDDFEKENPNIHVVNNQMGGNYDGLKNQIVTDLTTEDYADIVECYPDHVERYFDFGKVAELSDLIYDPEVGIDNIEDMIGVYLEEGTKYSMSGIYSLPLSKSTDVMYYNASILGKTIPGVYDDKPIDTNYINNLTWDELFDVFSPAVQAYNAAHPYEKLYDDTVNNACVFGWDSDQNLFVTLAEQYQYGYTDVDQTTGQGELLWNNENMQKLLMKFREASDNKYFVTTGSNSGTYVNNIFTAGGCIFSVGSSAGYSYQINSGGSTFEIAVAQIPQAPLSIEDRKVCCINQGPSVCFLRHPLQTEERLRAAMKFYNFFITTKNNAEWSTNTGYIPVRNSVASTNKFINYIDVDNIHTDVKSVDHLAAVTMKYAQSTLTGDVLFSNVTFSGSTDCRSYCGALVTEILTAKKAPTFEEVKELFKTAENNVRAAMK